MTYRFVWSPEGREVFRTKASNHIEATLAFRKSCPAYARFMGEVYWEVV